MNATKEPLAIRLRAYGWLLVSSVLMFLGFVGFGVWPLAFVGSLPALFALDPQMGTRGGFARPMGRAFFFRAWFFGYVAYFGGFYWITNTLMDFSGFNVAISSAFASIYYLYQGLQFVLALYVFAKGRALGLPAVFLVPVGFLAAEAIYPSLFEHYYGNAFADLPLLTQVADLGGPELCTFLAMLVQGALYDVLAAALERKRLPRVGPAIAISYVLFVVAYGAHRIAEEDARVAAAPHLRVGIVQANLGLFERWEDPRETFRRHIGMTEALEAREHVDLVVWPESSVTTWLERVPSLRAIVGDRIHAPVLFGGIRRREHGDVTRMHNTAFLADRDGNFIGAYDKIHLLAFGEYLPFGDQFPVLYEISPMSGQMSPGEEIEPMSFPFGEGAPIRIAPLVCYEDILGAFVREVVDHGDPHVMVNIAVDSWFGDTQEPWVHLALARFRTIEHRRWLVRSTITGVSAFVDSAGRVVAHTGTFEQATLVRDVPLLAGARTVYQVLGPFAGWVALGAALFVLREARRAAAGAAR